MTRIIEKIQLLFAILISILPQITGQLFISIYFYYIDYKSVIPVLTIQSCVPNFTVFVPEKASEYIRITLTATPVI